MIKKIGFYTLDELLNQFNKIKTWTSEKKQLKLEIIKCIKKQRLYIFTGSKHKYKLKKFGETRKVTNLELGIFEVDVFKNRIELICIGQAHCDYMFIAAREVVQSKSTNSK